MEVKEIRLKFIEDIRDELWRRKERIRHKRKLKNYSWERYFMEACLK